MAEYSFSDVSEAKRRVQEMKNRAREQSGEGSALPAQVVASPANGREKALLLAMLYLTERETDEALIAAMIHILFN